MEEKPLAGQDLYIDVGGIRFFQITFSTKNGHLTNFFSAVSWLSLEDASEEILKTDIL